jgi:hypothetical protein
VLEDGLDVFFEDEIARWIARTAEVDQFYRRVGGERSVDFGWLGAEVVGRVEGCFDDFHVIDLGRDRVHAVSGWASEDFVFAGSAESAKESIDGLIATYADEEIGWSEVLVCVDVGVPEVDEVLF